MASYPSDTKRDGFWDVRTQQKPINNKTENIVVSILFGSARERDEDTNTPEPAELGNPPLSTEEN